jgi:N4-gp56 family major capsid protein
MALTQVSSLDLSKAAYEQIAYYALRPELYYDALVEVKSTDATNRGVSVTFTIASDLAEATSALTETSDITPVAMADSYITVTPLEYGNAIQLTAKLGATAFMEVNPIAAQVIGWNAGISTDGIARAAAGTGTQVAYSGAVAGRTSLAKTNTLIGSDVRNAVAKLRKQNVATFNGMYKGLIHPDVSYDFRGATGGTNWSDPHVYSDPSGIYNGVIGNFQGVQFMETPRAPFFSDGGTNSFTISTITVASNVATLTTSAAHGLSVGDTLTISGATATSGTGSTSQLGFNAQFVVTTVPTTTTLTVSVLGLSNVNPGTSLALVVSAVDVYGTLVLGRQALAKAFSTGGGYGIQPILVDIPVIDTLRRFTGVGWKHFVGYAPFRQAALFRIESGSSIGQ